MVCQMTALRPSASRSLLFGSSAHQVEILDRASGMSRPCMVAMTKRPLVLAVTASTPAAVSLISPMRIRSALARIVLMRCSRYPPAFRDAGTWIQRPGPCSPFRGVSGGSSIAIATPP